MKNMPSPNSTPRNPTRLFPPSSVPRQSNRTRGHTARAPIDWPTSENNNGHFFEAETIDDLFQHVRDAPIGVPTAIRLNGVNDYSDDTTFQFQNTQAGNQGPLTIESGKKIKLTTRNEQSGFFHNEYRTIDANGTSGCIHMEVDSSLSPDDTVLCLDRVFVANGSAPSGAGIYCRNARLIMENSAGVRGCVCDAPQAEDALGAGLYCEDSILEIIHAQFDINTHAYKGGGIYLKNPHEVFFDTLSLTSNKANFNDTSKGGGIYIDVDSSLNLRAQKSFIFNVINWYSNEAISDGGALYSDSAIDIEFPKINYYQYYPYIDNNISRNGNGGAIALNNNAITLKVADMDLGYNQSGGNGGGIWMNGGDVSFNSIQFHRNITDGNGGAMWKSGGTVRLLTRSIFVENIAEGDGGAIWYANISAPLKITDTEFTFNTANNGGAIGYGDRSTDLPKLMLYSSATFKGNKALRGYKIDPQDIPEYSWLVHSSAFTAPFYYGYNNYDIEYTDGIELKALDNVPVYYADGCISENIPTDDLGTIVMPPDPPLACAPDGASFCGWATNPEMTEKLNSGSLFTEYDALYACWDCANNGVYDNVNHKCVYPVTIHHPNGVTESFKIDHGIAMQEPPLPPCEHCTRPVGWSSTPDGNSIVTFPLALDGPMTLYPVYECEQDYQFICTDSFSGCLFYGECEAYIGPKGDAGERGPQGPPGTISEDDLRCRICRIVSGGEQRTYSVTGSIRGARPRRK